MRIVQVSAYDYPFPGGVTEHISNLDRQLRRMGHQTWILAASSKDEDELHGNVIKVGSSLVEVPFSGSIARITLSPQVWRRVKHILDEGQFDIVHLHEPLTPLLPLAVLRHSHAVNVGTFHAYRESHLAYKRGKRFLQPFFGRLDGLIAVSEAARDNIGRYFGGRFVIIPNGIDVEHFGNDAIKPIPRFTDGRLNILFVGRLEKRKGFGYLLRAFHRIQSQIPETRLIVVGPYDKEDKAPFIRFARANRIRHVKFVGYVPSEDIPRYYHTCHVFCAPSTGFESFGIVLLEAMASGKPVVATDIPGYRSVLTDGQEGLLVEPENETALAEAIMRLIKQPDLARRMGERGRQTAHYYAWPRIAEQVAEYYEELLAQRQRDVDARERAERSFRELVSKASGWFDPRNI
jgi:phosphatidylinositol alpha-mannosyltransferase